MLTYHNDPALKAEFVARMRAHIEADEVIQGLGFADGRGCAVGCTYNEYDHSLGPSRLGLPEWYERLRDVIFESLPAAEAPAFALASLEAVPVGVDVERLWIPLAVARHQRSLERLEGDTAPHAEQCRAAIRGVIDWLDDGAPEGAAAAAAAATAESAAESAAAAAEAAWSAARSAAWSARSARSARSAAWSAAAAAESAWSAARSAAWSARSAAWLARSAAWSAAAAARSAESAESAWRTERDTLLALLGVAP